MGSKRKRGTEKVFKEIKTKISKFGQETFTHRIKKISKPTPNMMNQKQKKKDTKTNYNQTSENKWKKFLKAEKNFK
jgi:hypothetical protein